MSREGLKLSLLENNNGGGGSSSSGNNNGAPTLTTPTLTPTTLRNIEQMLLDSGESPVLHACEPPELHENAAGFVPPSVELPMTSEYEADDKLQSSLDWVLTQPGSQVPNNAPYNSPPPPQPVPPVIASLIKDPSAAALPGPTNILLPLLSNLTPVSSMNSTSQSITALPSVPSCSLINNPDNHSSSSNPPSMPTAPAPVVNHNNNNVVINAKKRNAVQSAGNRRNGSSSIAINNNNNNNNNNNIHNNDSSQLTPEEKLKRDLRRERNKEAAARCRKRRLDQTLNLQDEVEELDSKKMSLQKELESLRAQKEELEVLLNNHKAGHCAVIGSVVKKEPLEEPACIIKTELSESSTNLACTVGGQ